MPKISREDIIKLIVAVSVFATIVFGWQVLSHAQIHQIDRLYARPDGTSQVVYILPNLIQIHIVEVKDYSTCVWVALSVKINFLGYLQHIPCGWVYIPKIAPRLTVLKGKGYNSVDNTLAYPELLEQASHKEGIPPKLMAVVQRLETGHIPIHLRSSAVSRCGAIGIYQIMPFHAKSFGYTPKALYDPKVNTEVSAKILNSLYKQYSKDIELTLAAYNGGPGQAKLAQKNRCPETKAYVKRGLKLYASS